GSERPGFVPGPDLFGAHDEEDVDPLPGRQAETLDPGVERAAGRTRRLFYTPGLIARSAARDRTRPRWQAAAGALSSEPGRRCTTKSARNRRSSMILSAARTWATLPGRNPVRTQFRHILSAGLKFIGIATYQLRRSTGDCIFVNKSDPVVRF